MRKLLFTLIVLKSFTALSQQISLKELPGTKAGQLLKNAFSQKDVNTVVISSSMRLDDTLKIPAGKTLKFEPGCFISGKGTIIGGIIDAGYQQKIFDSSLNVELSAVNQYFSVKWFGAMGNNTDDYFAIQKAINTCIKNNIRTLYFPAGNYKISKPLIIRGTGTDNLRQFCTLEILGESTFWDSNMGSEIRPQFKDGFAFGIQRGKGCKIRKLRITGQFKAPSAADPIKFNNISFNDFTDHVSRDNRNSPYAAIVIDPFTNTPDHNAGAQNFYPGLEEYYGTNGKVPESGSTATELEELSISNFVVGICSSPNGITRNAEITLINKVQFANCKLCISGGQDQEKDNTISNVYCWGGTHTIFATGLYGNPRMAGNWNIDRVNIAGSVIRFIYNDQHGYFSSYISHVFAESLGTWGTLNSELSCEVSDCHIDFEYESRAGKRTLLTSWGSNVVYRSCNFRFYGEKTALPMAGNCVFEHCYFSGPVTKEGTFNFLFYVKDKFRPSYLVFAFSILLITGVLLFRSFSKPSLFDHGNRKNAMA